MQAEQQKLTGNKCIGNHEGQPVHNIATRKNETNNWGL